MLFLLILAVIVCGVVCWLSMFVGACAALDGDFVFTGRTGAVALVCGAAASLAYGAILSWGA